MPCPPHPPSGKLCMRCELSHPVFFSLTFFCSFVDRRVTIQEALKGISLNFALGNFTVIRLRFQSHLKSDKRNRQFTRRLRISRA
jgi:hypothetical protein